MIRKIKLFLVMIPMMVLSLSAIAQTAEKTVTLVVSGDGPTKEEAVKQALRSAIEQAFGTFVSANTEVLNDEIIRDEIVTVSSGNITNYKEVNTLHNSDGTYSSTVEATVSIGKLTNFARSKGMSVELATGAFAMNMKIRELNKENEIQAIKDLQTKLIAMNRTYKFFNYNLVLGEPFIKGDNYAVQAKIEIVPNKNLANFRNTIVSTLKALSLTELERVEYERAKIPYKAIKIREYNSDDIFLSDIQSRINHPNRGEQTTIYLRNTDESYPDLLFPWIMLNNELGFSIVDNTGSGFGFYFCIEEPYPDEKYLLAYERMSKWALSDFSTKLRHSGFSRACYWFSGMIANNKDLYTRIIPQKFIYYDMDEDFNIHVYESEKGRININEAPAFFSFEIEYPKDIFSNVNNIELILSNPYFLK